VKIVCDEGYGHGDARANCSSTARHFYIERPILIGGPTAQLYAVCGVHEEELKDVFETSVRQGYSEIITEAEFEVAMVMES
jgi:hypothetical protein